MKEQTKRTFELREGILEVVPSFKALPLQDDEDVFDLSIRQQEAIRDYLREGQIVYSCGRSETCALCQAFLDLEDEGCNNCPIYKVLGAWECVNTPFSDWDNMSKEASTIPDQIEIIDDMIEWIDMVRHEWSLREE